MGDRRAKILAAAGAMAALVSWAPAQAGDAVSRAYTINVAPALVTTAWSRAITITPVPTVHVATSRAVTVKYCVADVDGDSLVAVTDLIAVILDWGTSGACTDLDNSGAVDVVDLVTVILNWGPCP